MTKRVDLSLTIDLPPNHEADRVTVSPDGQVRVFDNAGNVVIPTRVERATHYERPKGRKYQARANYDRGYASVGGLEELASLDSFIVIDTNSVEVEGIAVSVAFFIVCKLIPDKDGFRLASLDSRAHAYEFHNVPGNPEMLAILKVANDTIRGRDAPGESRIAFITDSELDSHQAISKRELAIYGEQHLPQGFALIYASADTGQELTNRLIRFCDAESAKYLAKLKDGAFRKTGLARLDEDPSVVFRYTYYPDLKIINPAVTGTTITPETKSSIQFTSETDE